MKLDSVRALKNTLLTTVLPATMPNNVALSFPLTMALGVTKDKAGEHVLAVRVYSRNPPWKYQPFLELIKTLSCGEFDLQYSDQIRALAHPENNPYPYAWEDVCENCNNVFARHSGKDNYNCLYDASMNFVQDVSKPFKLLLSQEDKTWNQKRVRPLMIGTSVGHHKITCGSIGCFATRDGKKYILSNNHVIANQDQAEAGDEIRQPGTHDGGTTADKVAALTEFVKMKDSGNKVDAAIAEIGSDTKYVASTIKGIGKINVSKIVDPEIGMELTKLGRTTGITRGRVTAIEMDSVRVGYSRGVLSFDHQMEIEGMDDTSASAGGDSGSCFVEAKTHHPVGLLFAGGGAGGKNGKGLTYANYMSEVTKALKITLIEK